MRNFQQQVLGILRLSEQAADVPPFHAGRAGKIKYGRKSGVTIDNERLVVHQKKVGKRNGSCGVPALRVAER